MKYRNNWKRILFAGLGLTLTFGQTAYAEIIVPPIPIESGAGAGMSGIAGPGVPGTNDDSNQTTSDTGRGTSETAAQNTEQKPTVSAEGAVLLDAATGKVLFGKNENQQFYPASITKVMTALVVLERCNLNDVVTFSSAATTNLESGAVSLDISEGDKLTVEQCLYGLLLKSANEIGNGLAEHVAGSVSAFADLMNAKAIITALRRNGIPSPSE